MLKKEKEEHELLIEKINQEKEDKIEEVFDTNSKIHQWEAKKMNLESVSDSSDEPLPARIEETKIREKAEFIGKYLTNLNLIALPKSSKDSDAHIAIHYNVGDTSYLYIKKPNSQENNSQEFIHEHLCSCFYDGKLTIDIREKCGRELIETLAENNTISKLRGLEINFLDKNDETFTKFLNNSIDSSMELFIINNKGLDKFKGKKKLPFTPYKDIIMK